MDLSRANRSHVNWCKANVRWCHFSSRFLFSTFFKSNDLVSIYVVDGDKSMTCYHYAENFFKTVLDEI